MNKQVNCIMLIDDNKTDNFFHERVIKKYNAAKIIVVKESGQEALDYLMNKEYNGDGHPDIIFLDINMPGMNGWEFLEQYHLLDEELQSKMVVVMLTTSDNPDDKAQAVKYGIVTGFKTKPLTKEILDEVFKAFPN